MNKYSGSSYDKYNTIYPNNNEVLRPFRQTIYNSNLKVIMLFDEPYNNGEATGLPLHIDDSHHAILPRSKYQHNVYSFEKLLQAENTPYNILDITSWCNQGVLLYPMAMTSEHNKLNEHLTTWLPFTETLLMQIVFNNPNAILVTFTGNVSHSARKVVSGVNGNNKILNSPAAYNTQFDYKEFSEYNVLKRINDELSKRNEKTIKWI